MIFLAVTSALVSACSNGSVSESTETTATEEGTASMTASEVNFTPDESTMTTAKPFGPVKISYRVIGQPIVGQPVAIDLRFSSAMESQSFNVSYRVNDSTALQFPETQALAVAIAPTLDEGDGGTAAQQVTVIPMREGRLYLNVAAQIETDTGSMSSVTAVPIQVGQAPRELVENGVVTTDENGELIRTLPATED